MMLTTSTHTANRHAIIVDLRIQCDNICQYSSFSRLQAVLLSLGTMLGKACTSMSTLHWRQESWNSSEIMHKVTACHDLLT